MSYGQASDKKIAFKVQSALGTASSGAGASGLLVHPGAGMQLQKAIIDNPVVRYDGQSSLGRHGTKHSTFSTNLPFRLSEPDLLIQAVLRGTTTATFDITEASVLGGSAAATSITTTTSTIVFAAGSALLQGVRIGMKVKLAGHSTAANNGKWFRVVGVSALVITVAGTPLTTNAVADTAFTLTVAKHCLNGATPVERYWTVEEYLSGVMDLSKLGTDMKVCKMTFNAQPNRNIELTFDFMGLDMTPQASGASPVFTTPTYQTTSPLIMKDGTIRIAGVDYSVLTGFQFTWDMGGQAPAVLANASPDIFLGNGKLSGSFSAIRQDLSFLTAFRSETTVDFFVDCVENESDPADFSSFYVGNATLSGNSDNIASEGPDIETIPWNAGIDEVGTATGHASTSLLWTSSAA